MIHLAVNSIPGKNSISKIVFLTYFRYGLIHRKTSKYGITEQRNSFLRRDLSSSVISGREHPPDIHCAISNSCKSQGQVQLCWKYVSQELDQIWKSTPINQFVETWSHLQQGFDADRIRDKEFCQLQKQVEHKSDQITCSLQIGILIGSSIFTEDMENSFRSLYGCFREIVSRIFLKKYFRVLSQYSFETKIWI